MPDPFNQNLCDYKHKSIDKKLDEGAAADKEQSAKLQELHTAMKTGTATQAMINEVLQQQLDELLKWKREKEQKPSKRWDHFIMAAIGAGAGLIVGMFASKILGLG